jgi:hypothetical protein
VRNPGDEVLAAEIPHAEFGMTKVVGMNREEGAKK